MSLYSLDSSVDDPVSRALDTPAVIFDNGTGLCKVGFAGQFRPHWVISSVVGYPRFNLSLPRFTQQNYTCGEEALFRYDEYRQRCPIQRGLIMGWEEMEDLWRYLFKCELEVKPSAQPVFMTEPTLNPREIREKTAEVMFETFCVPTLYLYNQAALSLYASARLAGLVLDSGDGITCAVPISEGVALPQAITMLYLAGKDLTEQLTRLLLASEDSYSCRLHRGLVADIKEKLCYVTLDVDTELNKSPEEVLKEYTLPDGNIIRVGEARYQTSEVLFEPYRLGVTSPGVSAMVINNIVQCDTSIQNTLFEEIELAGGTTLLPGFEQRLLKELQTLTGGGVPIKIRANLNRGLSRWIGASIVTSSDGFRQNWITSGDFYEYGPSVVQRKCYNGL